MNSKLSIILLFICFIFFGSTNLYSQSLDDKLNVYACDCFTKNSGDSNALELCLGGSFEENKGEMMMTVIDEYDIDTTLTSSSDLQVFDGLIEDWTMNKLKGVTEKLILECSPFYNYVNEEINHTDFIKELVPFDSVAALKKIPVFTELIENDLGYTQTFTKRGSLFLTIGETEKAINDFNKAVSLDSTNISAITFLGFSYFLSKKYKEAETHFDTLYNLTREMSFLMFRSLMIKRQLNSE